MMEKIRMRLIDADALKESAYKGYHTPGEIDPMVVDADDIENAQTVYSIEVTRCKDCIKRNTPDCLMWYNCSICGGQWTWETDNDYCSAGERKDGVKNDVE
jgi:hypothetical protein